MMDNVSTADLLAMRDGNGMGGFGNGGGDFLLLVLFLFMFGQNGFGQNGWGGAATAAAQQEILSGQQFDAVHGKLDSIGKGICDSTYALNNSIKDCCCATQMGMKDIIANNDQNTSGIVSAMNAGFQRVMDNQNGIEMQHLRDAQMRDYIDKSLCGVVRWPMGFTYSTNCNPFCPPQGNPCGYGCGNNGF